MRCGVYFLFPNQLHHCWRKEMLQDPGLSYWEGSGRVCWASKAWSFLGACASLPKEIKTSGSLIARMSVDLNPFKRTESLLVSHARNPEPFKSTLPISVKWTRDNTLDSITLTSSPRSKGSLIPSSSSKYRLLLRLDVLEHGSPCPKFLALLYNWKILFIECHC